MTASGRLAASMWPLLRRSPRPPAAAPSIPSRLGRQLHTTTLLREQHLLWSGTLLDKTSARHTPLDLDLLLAAGGGDEIDVQAGGGVHLLGAPVSSPVQGHVMLCYRTAVSPALRHDVEEGIHGEAPADAGCAGLTRLLSIGRNTHAQLGCGFASHEATFGLVRPGFSGAGGVVRTAVGPGQSWLVTANEIDGPAKNAFACGSE